MTTKTKPAKSKAKHVWLAKAPRVERLPSGAEHAAELDAAARELTGAGPGDPAYEAIVNPRMGRPLKGESYKTVSLPVRLPKDAAKALRLRADELGVRASALARAAVLTMLKKNSR